MVQSFFIVLNHKIVIPCDFSMKLNKQLFQINRNFAIGFAVTTAVTATTAQVLSYLPNYLNTTITMGVGYLTFFGIFALLFYFDNRKRYKKMKSEIIKKELKKVISSLGIGEILYIITRWSTLYFFLEIGLEAFLASVISSIIAAVANMAFVTIFLRKTKTY